MSLKHSGVAIDIIKELEAVFLNAWQGAGAPEISILAVSGGGDSMAMMNAAAACSLPGKCIVITVDHGLRAQAAAEARFVAERANAAGLRHETLTWCPGEISAGVMAEARSARYALLALCAAKIGATAIFTAHNADDVAETLMMRLARGSGAKALANMHRSVQIAAGPGVPIPLIRPFLSQPRDALRAAAGAAGEDFIDDPTNSDASFERVRMRAFLASAGREIGLAPGQLEKSARRLAATAAIEAAQQRDRAAALGLRFEDWGGLSIDPDLDLARDNGVFARLVHAVGGDGYSPAPDIAHRALAQVVGGATASLAGVIVRPFRGRIFFYREPAALLGRADGTSAIAPMAIDAGQSILWDGRFIVTAGAATSVSPLGQFGAEMSAITGFNGPRDALLSMPRLGLTDAPSSPLNAPDCFKSLAGERFHGNVIRFADVAIDRKNTGLDTVRADGFAK